MRVLVTGHLGFVGGHLVAALRETCDVVGLDLRDGHDVTCCNLPDGVDRVFHLAAQTNAQSDDVVRDALTNVIGTARILAKYRERVVLASSSMVNYPVSPYAISKRACEDYARLHGAAIVRLCNLYGDGGHSLMDKLISAEPIVLRGSGNQRRTYAHIDRAVDMLLSALPGTTQVLYGVDLTVNEMIDMFPLAHVTAGEANPLDVVEGVQL